LDADIYLREMGSIRLLSRQAEVDLALPGV
jgi:hypothetical protein